MCIDFQESRGRAMERHETRFSLTVTFTRVWSRRASKNIFIRKGKSLERFIWS